MSGNTYVATKAASEQVLWIRYTATNGSGSITFPAMAATVPKTGITALTMLTRRKVLMLGDSTTMGVGSNPLGVLDTDVPHLRRGRRYSVPGRVPNWLKENSLAAISESVSTEGSAGIPDYMKFRSDMVWSPTNPAVSSRGNTVGGASFRYSGVNQWSFTTSIPVDTIEFGLIRFAGTGTVQLQVDGANHSTYVQGGGPDDYILQTVSVPLGIHTFTFKSASGTIQGPMYLNAYNSAVPALEIIGAGVRNMFANGVNGTTWPQTGLNALATIDPDIVVIDFGINNWRQSGTTFAAIKTDLQTLITAALATGAKVVLSVPHRLATYNTATHVWTYAETVRLYTELQTDNPGTYFVESDAAQITAGIADRTALNNNGGGYDALHNGPLYYHIEGDAVGAAIKSIVVAEGWAV
jgi:hypothetical protein